MIRGKSTHSCGALGLLDSPREVDPGELMSSRVISTLVVVTQAYMTELGLLEPT